MPASRILLDTSPLRESRPFRNIVIARAINVFGIGMLTVAVSVQVYALTGSSTQVGAVATTTGVATFAGSLLGGVLADRNDRRPLILWSRCLCGLAFAGLAVNAMFDDPSVLAIYVLGAVDGGLGAISFTALLAATPGLISPDKFSAAAAINGLTAEVGMMTAPAVGGLVIAAGGVTWNYSAAALGTFATLPLLSSLPPLRPEGAESIHPARSLIEGLHFAWNRPVIRSVLFIGVVALLGAGMTVLIPALVDHRFGNDPRAAGLLYSGIALGAGIGSVTSGWVATFERKGLLILVVAPAGLGLIALTGATPWLWATFLFLMAAGLAIGVRAILEFTLLQRSTPDRLRGRINSVWSAMTVLGGAFGSMLAGALGSVLPPPVAIAVYGGGLTAIAAAGLVVFGRLRLWRDDQ
ncbi:ENTS family enterobactin (siderophore) exporter [Williamsia limnetica]|uniref:ENTS family enterobactin (Siderophore) exporter n=1 Tax=Williamsia limnetica TaxID=882452 RepID=A0A318RVS9_WILLI|nr:enterobactin transporter EntS [Williamsia limnetica]PYE17314.1 ENTS family enterobactin (siderophore) exporter [Williamsia limnetica]